MLSSGFGGGTSQRGRCSSRSIDGTQQRDLVFVELLAEWPPTVELRPAPPIIMTDLDCFKSANGIHGHLVGDVALEEVGVRIARLALPGYRFDKEVW